MKVLLTVDVRKLGWLGDVVEVADGYARNYLLPQGLAQPATESNIRAIADAKAARAEERRLEGVRLRKAAEAVQEAEAVIAAAANEQGHLFGSVGAHAIAANLRAQGFEVHDDVIEGALHIKEVGTHKVTLEFAPDIKAKVSVVVVPEGTDIEEFRAAERAAKEAQEKAEAEAEAKAAAEQQEQEGQPEQEKTEGQ